MEGCDFLKKFFSILWRVLLAFLIYTLVGMLIPFIGSKSVSEEFKNDLATKNFYSESLSGERVKIVEDNDDAFKVRVQMIESANERIIVSTYKYRRDWSGLNFVSALYEASKRGVSVEFIVDGYTSATLTHDLKELKVLNTLPNFEVKVYNKINLLTPWKHNGRQHDKYVIIDNQSYVVGGRNITNSSLSNEYGDNKYDRDVFVYNSDLSNASSVDELVAYHENKWNSKAASLISKRSSYRDKEKVLTNLSERYDEFKAEYPSYFENTDFEAITTRVNKVSILTNPTHIYKKEPHIFYALSELMNNATSSIKVHSPYFIMDKQMYEVFNQIGERTLTSDLEATLFTNSAGNSANPFGSLELRINKDKLLNTNFTLYELESGYSYHSKSLTIDDELAIIGSFNFDMRSTYIAAEVMVVVHSEVVAAELNEYMEDYEQNNSVKYTNTGEHVPEGVIKQTLSFWDHLLHLLILIFVWWWGRPLF